MSRDLRLCWSLAELLWRLRVRLGGRRSDLSLLLLRSHLRLCNGGHLNMLLLRRHMLRLLLWGLLLLLLGRLLR